MTFDDDYLQLVFDGGIRRVTCRQAGVEWPPPQRLDIGGFTMVQSRRSEITDEQRQGLTHVCRGAEYFPERAA